ncbi:ABC transporter ATP-binding protein [Aureimonas sp. Leaf427]|uniref:polyamine ABC transporter ATP-binding protein n=2 Tax=unclassified Aureimonas TaxID=2615206 RepID=UPI00190FEB88|nr:ABC transporter ATP-binding protein [Aureimonas sp. Leaf427]
MKLVAIEKIDLDIRGGEFISLLGPSGSGKSTLLMMIAGFDRPTRGRISIGGRDVTDLPPERRGVGMVFQNYALFPHMTIAENVGFSLKQRGVGRAEREERVRRTLDLVQLSGYETRFPQQLSGGQQQRVAIARAVIFGPPVLLMDEPLSALDKQLREQMQLEIKGLHDRLGITFVYVTHDQREALTMSDRIAVLNHGRIEQIGPPTTLYDEPGNRFVASFIGEANWLSGRADGRRENGLQRVAVGDETIVARVGDAPASDEALCMIRPEKLRIEPSGGLVEPGINRLNGLVREAIFMGELTRYGIEVGGQMLHVKQPHRADMPVFRTGERASVEWAVADTRLL